MTDPFNVTWRPDHKLWLGIPYYMRGGLDRWIMRGVPPGDFLSAVLKNDLMSALKHADEMNATRLWQYGAFLYNVAPADCFGSPAAFDRWSDQGGLEGIITENTDASDHH